MDKVKEDCNGLAIVVFEDFIIVSLTVLQSSFFVVCNVVDFLFLKREGLFERGD